MEARRQAEQTTATAVNDYLQRIYRHRPYADAARRSVPFTEFRQLVRRVRPSVLLPALAAFTLADSSEPLSSRFSRTAPPWAVALAARESILWGNEYRDDTISGDYLRRLFNAHNDIAEPDLNGDGVVELLGILTRLAYEQFPYQESIFEEVSRTHALMVEGIDQVELEVLHKDDTWQRLLGAPLGQVVGATFFLQTGANVNAGWFDETWLDRPDLKGIYNKWPRHVIEHRAADLTSTPDQFKQAYLAAPRPSPGHERYAYNPLVARPFVHMPDGRVLAPQPRLVMRTISPGGLYYAGLKEFGTGFARDLGRLTERYVGELLAAVDRDVELHPEVTYGKPEKKSVDWFLVLPNVVVMFEVKSARYALLDRAAAPGFEQRTTALLNKATGQLVRTAEALAAKNPSFAHIPHDRPHIGIIVTGEPYYLANSGWMRDLLNEAPFPTLTASLREIEQLSGLSLHQVEEQLIRIANDANHSTWSLGTALKDVPGHRRSPVLERAWQAYPWIDKDDREPPSS